MSDFDYYSKLDFKSKSEIAATQNILLKKHIEYCFNTSLHYKEILYAKDVRSSDISMSTLHLLPLTDRVILEQNFNNFISVKSTDIIDISFTSGTTGHFIPFGYTESDINRIAYNEKRALTISGIKKEDTVLLLCTLDRGFVAGLAYYLGLKSIGAKVVRCGVAPLDYIVNVIIDLKPTILIGVPSFIKKLGVFAESKSVSLASIKKIVCIGEAIRGHDLTENSVCTSLKMNFNSDIFSTYALTETVTSFCECREGKGGHLLPELAAIEIVDESGNIVRDGEVGEVVITPLGIEGIPLIRYKTGDLSFLHSDICECGRNTPRLGPILGRKTDKLKIKGTTIYSGALLNLINSVDAVRDYYVELIGHDGIEESISIFLHIEGNEFDVIIRELTNLFYGAFRFFPKIIPISKSDIDKKVFGNGIYRKAKRFFDLREGIKI